MKRYTPAFVQPPGETETWYGMKEDSDGDWYSRAEADVHIEELKRAIDSCLLVLALELTERGKFQKSAMSAIEEAKKALSL